MKRPLTVQQMAKMGARAQRRKYSKKQLREWAKMGGRPRKQAQK